MKKPSDPDIQDKYDFSQGVRGKYAARYAKGSNVVVLDPDVAEVFRDSEAINRMLRAIGELVKAQSAKPGVRGSHRSRSVSELRSASC